MAGPRPGCWQQVKTWVAGLTHGRLPVFNPQPNIPLYKSHGIDLTQFPTFGDVTGTEEVNAVQPHNSVFHSLLKLCPYDEFDRAIDATMPRTSPCFSHNYLVAISMPVRRCASLRDIEAA